MHRYPAILVIPALLAALSLVGIASTASADESDDHYYEDEYAEDTEEAEEVEEIDEALAEKFKYARTGFYLYGGLAQGFEHLPAENMATDPLGINRRSRSSRRPSPGSCRSSRTSPDLWP